MVQEEFLSDDKTQSAVIRQLEILGEAAKRVSENYRNLHPEVRWKEIAGLRDRLIHGYDLVDLDVVWEILESDIPTLIRLLEGSIPREPD